MKCPNCGAEVKAKYCEYCGSEIPKEKEATVVNITNNYNYYGNRDAKKTISNTKNANRQIVSKKNLNNTSKEKALKIILAVDFIIIVFILLIAAVRDSNNRKDKTKKPVIQYSTVLSPRESNGLQELFLSMSPETTHSQFLSLVEQSDLICQEIEPKGEGTIEYTVTMKEDEGKNRIKISFVKNDVQNLDGELRYAELKHDKSNFLIPIHFVIFNKGSWVNLKQKNNVQGYYRVTDITKMSEYKHFDSADECLYGYKLESTEK